MRIHCDACRAAIEEDAALVVCDEDGELFYFCSEACYESAESLDPDREPEREQAIER